VERYGAAFRQPGYEIHGTPDHVAVLNDLDTTISLELEEFRSSEKWRLGTPTYKQPAASQGLRASRQGLVLEDIQQLCPAADGADYKLHKDVLEAFFAALDPVRHANTFANFDPVFNAVIHDKLTVHLDSRTQTKAEWAADWQVLVEAGVLASDLKMHTSQGNVAHYSVTLRVGAASTSLHDRVTFEDAKIIAICHLDPTALHRLVLTTRNSNDNDAGNGNRQSSIVPLARKLSIRSPGARAIEKESMEAEHALLPQHVQYDAVAPDMPQALPQQEETATTNTLVSAAPTGAGTPKKKKTGGANGISMCLNALTGSQTGLLALMDAHTQAQVKAEPRNGLELLVNAPTSVAGTTTGLGLLGQVRHAVVDTTGATSSMNDVKETDGANSIPMLLNAVTGPHTGLHTLKYAQTQAPVNAGPHNGLGLLGIASTAVPGKKTGLQVLTGHAPGPVNYLSLAAAEGLGCKHLQMAEAAMARKIKEPAAVHARDADGAALASLLNATSGSTLLLPSLAALGVSMLNGQ
jgi:hypothetical protein